MMNPSALASDIHASLLAREAQTHALAEEILAEVLRYRRAVSGLGCAGIACPACLSPHVKKVAAAISVGRPVSFVLPAFPGKSPNAAKVLSPLPDLAERRALEFLDQLCTRIATRYAPGAEVILCSDGRVFSDVVGMKEANVTAYQREISRLIEGQGLTNLRTFNLEDVFPSLSFAEMRERLMQRFGAELEELKRKVRAGDGPDADQESKEALRMYRGITRFLVEDATHPGQQKSRTAVQKDCRVRAYEVIRRSNAWGSLIEEQFPEAIRLSIHPQTCGAKKVGIRLLESESWMTPWHGVALEAGGRLLLVKRAQAEALGARLVEIEGRASHFELNHQPLPAEVF